MVRTLAAGRGATLTTDSAGAEAGGTMTGRAQAPDASQAAAMREALAPPGAALGGNLGYDRVRFPAPVLSRMLRTWFATVFGLTKRRSAISRLLLPPATSRCSTRARVEVLLVLPPGFALPAPRVLGDEGSLVFHAPSVAARAGPGSARRSRPGATVRGSP